MSVCKFGLLDSPPPHLATYFNGFFFFRLLDFIVVVVVLLGEFRLPMGGRIMCRNSVGTESINYRIVKKSLDGPTNKNIMYILYTIIGLGIVSLIQFNFGHN